MKNLVDYNKLTPSRMGNFFDDFFNRNITDFFGSDFAVQSPSINIVENEESFRIEVAAPGLTKSDFNISVESGLLKIEAKKAHKEEVKEDKFVRREFNFSSFTRSFQLPDAVDADNINANYEQGVLILTLPKLEEAKAKLVKVIEIS